MMNEIVLTIITLVTTTIIALIGNTVNSFIKNKNISQVKLDKLNQLSNLIFDSIRTTQQTYVDTLKDNNIFNFDSQNEALNKAKEILFKNLPDDLLLFLQELAPNLNDFIEFQIESSINYLKSKEEI